MHFLKAYTVNIYRQLHILTPHYDLLIPLTPVKFVMCLIKVRYSNKPKKKGCPKKDHTEGNENKVLAEIHLHL